MGIIEYTEELKQQTSTEPLKEICFFIGFGFCSGRTAFYPSG